MKEKMIKIIGIAMIAATVLYGILIFVFNSSGSIKSSYMDPAAAKNLFIILLLFSLVELFAAHPVKEKIWKTRKQSIKSTQDFYSLYLSVFTIELAMLESVAIYGLVLFFITGSLNLSLPFVVVSLSIQIIKFIQGYEGNIERKKTEFPSLKD